MTVPEKTSSPSSLSTGKDSPVITAWSTEVLPEIMLPSTAMVSPGRTLKISPAITSSAGMISSPLFVTRLAVRGVRCTSFSMPALAFATVSSSKSPPICMIKATSPAAKSSPIITEAIRAIETRTSAFISKAVIRPITASAIIGRPHKIMATHAISKGRSTTSNILKRSAIPEITRKVTSFFVPPHSNRVSTFSIMSHYLSATTF